LIEQIRSKSTTFIPTMKALCLNAHDEEEEQKTLQLAKNLSDLGKSTQKGLQALSENYAQTQAALERKIEEVKASSREVSNKVLNDVSIHIDKVEARVNKLDTKIDLLIQKLNEMQRMGGSAAPAPGARAQDDEDYMSDAENDIAYVTIAKRLSSFTHSLTLSLSHAT